MTPADTLSHACHVALGAELGDIDVQPGTDGHRVLHDAAALALGLYQEDRKALVRALQSVATVQADAGLTAEDIAGFLGGASPSTKKAPLPASTIAALLGMLEDAYARHNRLLAAAEGFGTVLASPALEKALAHRFGWHGRQVRGGAFLNFLAHEGVPAWLLASVRPNGVHAVHGFNFGDIGDLWAHAVCGMPGEAWCRAMGTGAVADLAVHAQALHLLMHKADAEYALGAQHLRLGVMGQGVPARALLEPAQQLLASTRAMVAASAAARQEVGARVPLHAMERLALTMAEGYTLATGVAAFLGLSEADALLSRWEVEVNDWVDVLDARKSRLAGKLLPMAMVAKSAERAKASLNRMWLEGLAPASNDK